ncbi:DUF2961 domain-containing protein [Puteibacter caeruleilacunae]|nr:DUF2961 domain-containing protein [Puteibacter caeruleilacunae]
MNRYIISTLLLLLSSISIVSAQMQKITIESLLREMVDRNAITEFPQNGYKQKQASSYNRESVAPDQPGWFADSDGIGFIRAEENNGQVEWVLMEDEGPGVITKIWAVCFYYGLGNTTGGNIKIYLDGAEKPVINTNFFNLIQGKDFIKAPFADESTRAGNLYFPIPYAKSCKITMDSKAFYNIINFRKYPKDTKVETFTMDAFNKANELIVEVGNTLNSTPSAKGHEITRKQQLKANQEMVFELPRGNNALKQFEVKLDNVSNIGQALRSVVISATFDGIESVWAPVGDFFGNVGKKREYNMWERSVERDGTMVCRWVMPYKDTGVFKIQNMGKETVTVSANVIAGEKKWTENTMHFYAIWRLSEPTATYPIFDYNFLEAKGEGVIVGDLWTVLNPIEGWWGEGDEKIYVDEDFKENFPSHFGTGTEDYYGWAGGVVPTPADEFSKPFLGNIIVGIPNSKGYDICTRTRSLDAIPFHREIKFDIESSCGKRSTSHFLQYAEMMYWYGKPGLKHNRKPTKKEAEKKLPQVEDLEILIEKAKQGQYAVDNALEIEEIEPYAKSKGVRLTKESQEDWQKKAQKLNSWNWGELSNGAIINAEFEKPGDYLLFKITEQFEKSTILLSGTLDDQSGIFDFFINGKLVSTYDFFSSWPSTTSTYLNLGTVEPVDNTFVIRIEYNGKRRDDKKVRNKLGLDFFLIENNFYNR